MKTSKTLAEKLLDKNKIEYKSYDYEVPNGFLDGVTVAQTIDRPINIVFKTLVCKSIAGVFIFVIPVDKELDLKLAAKVSGQKYIEMVPVKDILSLTGYIKGGCSPLAMKKQYSTFVDVSALNNNTIVFSAGKVGRQVEIKVSDLILLSKAQTANITKEDLC